jgi:hypothetical protein
LQFHCKLEVKLIRNYSAAVRVSGKYFYPNKAVISTHEIVAKRALFKVQRFFSGRSLGYSYYAADIDYWDDTGFVA